MQTWYQRHNVVTNAVEWTTEPYIYWQPRDHFKLLSSIPSDQMPREEWFDRSGPAKPDIIRPPTTFYRNREGRYDCLQ